jgi:quercetin dioxygenase-like cupin family protein
MKISRAASSPSSRAPADNFSGTVRRDALVAPESPSRLVIGTVTFEPGARTAWHTHPVGQLLIVTAGRGWVQVDGQGREEVTPGDSIWFSAGERHWHGATATTAMTHIAITEAVDGSAVTWLEHVSDADYGQD